MSTTLNTEQLECITNDVTAPVTPPKRGRGRPAKYAKEEREEKYKEARDHWNKTHLEQRYQMNDEYSSRTRFAYKILCEMWENKYFDDKNDKYKPILQNLIEHKKITI